MEVIVKLTELFLAELGAEAPRTRRALERVPEGKDDWKPHQKSMPLGRLAMLVAQMPSWIPLIIGRDELDVVPAAGSNVDQRPLRTPAELVAAMDKNVADAQKVLEGTTDEFLDDELETARAGKVVAEDPRYVVVRDTFMHLAHHRGQLTVYLRLNDAPVPSIYGPSADDQRFA
jgi:uncharacterized damage-inducible protein DinB